MNKHIPALTPEMATSEALRPAEMTPARVAEIQAACEATAKFADWYRAVPAHPAVAEYRANRLAQFLEAYHALKDVINE